MPIVKCTNNLNRFFPLLKTQPLSGNTVMEIIQALETRHPGIASYLLDDLGRMRKHVNIFISGVQVKDREALSDIVKDVDEIYIIQALSGG